MELKLGNAQEDFLRFRKQFNLFGALGIVIFGPSIFILSLY